MKRIVLDTHAVIWLSSGNRKMKSELVRFIEEAMKAGLVCISSVSIYEMLAIEKKGAFFVEGGMRKAITTMEEEGLTIVPVSKGIALQADGLPNIHRDPFDRIIAATAIQESGMLVTADAQLKRYPIDIIPI